MRVLFRADASLQIGTGHVMRCLTLADALRADGSEISFICRQLEGDLIEFISAKGYQVFTLPSGNQANIAYTDLDGLAHSHWLGGTQEEDFQACKLLLQQYQPDWLIVDHYALDERWEHELKDGCRKLMVIDDLADRMHCCDLLLDQTCGRKEIDYRPLVPDNCKLLLGSQYALLRPEFAAWREYSLKRRSEPQLKKLLVSLGGADPDNYTGQVLQALTDCQLPEALEIVVVMGPSSPHMDLVKKLAEALPYQTQVVSNVSNMAELMANADLAIGAAGATTWERCCLGLASILIVLADNQKVIAEVVSSNNAALTLDRTQLEQLGKSLAEAQERLECLSICSSKVTHGDGLNSVKRFLE